MIIYKDGYKYQLCETYTIDTADKLLQTICKQDGMSGVRAWWVYWGVRMFGNFATTKANKKFEFKAPCNLR